ncbi:MAG: [FeFe] hydrogenase H-cluster maturation GTPase HydF [Firmicutes bacterium]|nr:[FeFe] hydrogenase H-cluster maturation GTPase HydF [Bacillota bacterium]
MQKTPRSNRWHIALLGRQNAGKSSLLNAITGQQVALVSPIAGTTTDPVNKAMELNPFGPVLFIDTPGIDDTTDLGPERIKRTRRALRQAHMAIIVVDATRGLSDYEDRLAQLVAEQQMPALLVYNKIDLLPPGAGPLEANPYRLPQVEASAITGQGIPALKAKLVELAPPDYWFERPLVGDLLQPNDRVMLIIPLDQAAPKGRLILRQVQVLRDVLDHGASAVMARIQEAEQALANLKQPPKLVITDSRVFAQAAELVPPSVPLTSFSVLFARQKGDLATLVQGARAVGNLRPGDKVLIAEVCTHRTTHEDIGRVKIPRWLNQRVEGELEYTWFTGGDFPDNLSDYQLVIHCGACMITRRQMLARLEQVAAHQVPIVNYGVLIAYLQGIFPRALEPFGLAL